MGELYYEAILEGMLSKTAVPVTKTLGKILNKAKATKIKIPGAESSAYKTRRAYDSSRKAIKPVEHTVPKPPKIKAY